MSMRRTKDRDSLGHRLYLSRDDLQWSRGELAEKAGVSPGHIAKLERGDVKNVTIELAFALADTLGVSRAYLLGLSGKATPEGPDLDDLDELTREFLNIYQQLSDDKKKTLLNLAQMLRSSDEPRIIGKE